MQWLVLLISTAYSKCDKFRQWNSTHLNLKESVFKPKTQKLSLKKVFPTGIRTSFRLGFRHWLFWWIKINIYFLLFFSGILTAICIAFYVIALTNSFPAKSMSRRERNSFTKRIHSLLEVASVLSYQVSRQSFQISQEVVSTYTIFQLELFFLKATNRKIQLRINASIVVYSLLSVLHTYQNSIISSNLVGWDWRLSGVHAHEGRDRYG